MGKSKKRQRNKRNNQNTDVGSDERRPCFHDIIRENEDFMKYYKKQAICEDDEEFERMLNSLRSNLPTSFRITSCPKEEADALLTLIEGTFFKNLINSEANAEEHEPRCLPWYPKRYGWQIQITRKDIRKSEDYFRLHNFLISETSVGTISRQEVVSMIPPLLLDIQHDSMVLDMCAAPGSKTAQLVEILHASAKSRMPEGVVVANDIDNNRCYKLVHQVKRLNSPCALVINHDAAIMPNLYLTNGKDGSTSVMKFDRVLCDVPCTGDGTLRKNPDIWLKWNTANGNNLHGVQMRILKRGLEMLKLNGLLVYSTCSLNPIENEAVIHRLLVEAEGSVEILDVSSKLPGLIYRAGVTHWFPSSKDLAFYDSFEEVAQKWHTVVRPNMFPPTSEDATKYNLHRCVRILPHYQDTGGFFVAVLKKLRRLPWEAEEKPLSIPIVDNTVEACCDEKNLLIHVGKKSKKRLKLGFKEDPFVFFKPDEAVWPQIKEFYGIEERGDSFNVLPGCLLTRCAIGKKKNIYLTSPLMKNIITTNRSRVKLINGGVKALVRCEHKAVKCSFRLTHEGLSSMDEFIGNQRRIKLNKQELVNVLHHNSPEDPLCIAELGERSRQHVSEIGNGSCIIEFEETWLPIKFIGWRGTHTIRGYISTPDSVHYLRLLGEDVSKFDINKFKTQEIENSEENTQPTDAAENLKEQSASCSDVKVEQTVSI